MRDKAFWGRKRAVLENQPFYLEKRIEIDRHRLGPNTTPVDVSEPDRDHREPD